MTTGFCTVVRTNTPDEIYIRSVCFMPFMLRNIQYPKMYYQCRNVASKVILIRISSSLKRLWLTQIHECKNCLLQRLHYQLRAFWIYKILSWKQIVGLTLQLNNSQRHSLPFPYSFVPFNQLSNKIFIANVVCHLNIINRHFINWSSF